MSFVCDYGGKIAMTRKGKWVGTLDKPAALAGLAAYKRFFEASSRAQKTTDEAHPQPYDVMRTGQRRVDATAPAGSPAASATTRARSRSS